MGRFNSVSMIPYFVFTFFRKMINPILSGKHNFFSPRQLFCLICIVNESSGNAITLITNPIYPFETVLTIIPEIQAPQTFSEYSSPRRVDNIVSANKGHLTQFFQMN